ncbi:hypothetical protein [Nocardia sp. NPDC059691]|uniref:hypothetical protein n=1 Tax=Nocardia sp. NPDC059691 TaxID=3346908 RepID=UPI003678976B
MPQDLDTGYVRAALVTMDVLPPRHEPLAQLELWCSTTVAELPPGHARIIRPYVEWHILRDARRRAPRGRYTHGASHCDRSGIREAIGFLQWLDAQATTLADLTQDLVDAWLATYPGRGRQINSLLRWTARRQLTRPLEVPTSRGGSRSSSCPMTN